SVAGGAYRPGCGPRAPGSVRASGSSGGPRADARPRAPPSSAGGGVARPARAPARLTAERPEGAPLYNTRAMTPLDPLPTTRIAQFSSAERHTLFRAVEAAEAQAALFHRHRAGMPPVPHPIALTPFLVRRREMPGLRRLAALVHRVQAHAPRL